MISVTFDRTSLALADLVISTDPFAGNLHLPEDAASRPEWGMRRDYAPDSAYVAGRSLLVAVREASTLPLVVYAHAATTALLEAAKAELEEATAQFSYTVTLTVDGESQTWWADPELPSWGPVDSGMVIAHLARGSIVIPVNPA